MNLSSISQILIVASKLPAAKYFPSGLNDKHLIVFSCVSSNISESSNFPFIFFQMQITLSLPHDASILPLGCQATCQTRSEWCLSIYINNLYYHYKSTLNNFIFFMSCNEISCIATLLWNSSISAYFSYISVSQTSYNRLNYYLTFVVHRL